VDLLEARLVFFTIYSSLCKRTRYLFFCLLFLSLLLSIGESYVLLRLSQLISNYLGKDLFLFAEGKKILFFASVCLGFRVYVTYLGSYLASSSRDEIVRSCMRFYFSRSLCSEHLISSSEFLTMISDQSIKIPKILEIPTTIAQSVFGIIAYLGILISLNPTLSISFIIVLFLLSFLYIQITSHFAKEYGLRSSRVIKSKFRQIANSINLTTEIRHYNLSSIVCENIYLKSIDESMLLAKSSVLNILPSLSVQLVVPVLGVITIFSYFRILDIPYQNSLAFLSAFALAGPKILSSFTMIQNSVGQFTFYSNVTRNIVTFLAEQMKHKPLVEYFNLSPSELDIYMSLYSRINREKISPPGQMHRISSSSLIIPFSFPKTEDADNFEALTLYPGEWVMFVGRSGCGKSTFLQLLAKSLHPHDDHLASSVYKTIGLSRQNANLIEGTIEDNIKFFCPLKYNQNDSSYHINKVLRSTCFDFIMESRQLSLSDIISHDAPLLSGGQKQILMVARALYVNPSLLILDETLSGIDLPTLNRIITNIRSEYPQISVLCVTHNDALQHLFDTRWLMA